MSYYGTKVATKDVSIARLFPGYRKRTVIVKAAESVSLYNLNWDGGSRYEYHLVNIRGGIVSRLGNSVVAPWDNKDEGQSVKVNPGQAIVQTGTFCGNPSTMVITFNPCDWTDG